MIQHRTLLKPVLSFGGERVDEITASLHRSDALKIMDTDIINFINDKPIEEAVDEFVLLLKTSGVNQSDII